MSPGERLCLVALRTGKAPVWLAPWLRSDFEYALVQPVLDVNDTADPVPNETAAVLALVAELRGPGTVWYLVTAAPATTQTWRGAQLAAVSDEQSAAAMVTARCGHEDVALIAVPDRADPPSSQTEAAAGAAAVLIVLAGSDIAVLGAPDVLTRSHKIGVLVRDGSADPPEAMGNATRRDRIRGCRSRRLAATGGVALAIAGIVLAIRAGSPGARTQRSPNTPGPRTSALPQAGLLLPDRSRFPGGRDGASVAFDPLTGSVTLFGGGRIGGGAQDALFPRDTWSWDVSGWHRRDTTIAPPPASHAAFAYDEDTGSALLFSSGETWQWNGQAWRGLHPARHPGPDVFAAAVFDPRRRSVVLVALCCQTSPPRSRAPVRTWVWRGTTWARIDASNPPLLSRAPLIAYDDARGELLLLTQGATPVSTTTDEITTTSSLWSFDGASWRRLSTPTSPPYDPLRDRLVYDPASRRMVLFQGGDLPTWTWNGAAWHAFAAGGPLYSGAVSTDATVGRVLLFGGSVASADLSSVWTFDAGRWKNVSRR